MYDPGPLGIACISPGPPHIRNTSGGGIVRIPSSANNSAVLPDPVGPTTRLTFPCSNVTSSIRSLKARAEGS